MVFGPCTLVVIGYGFGGVVAGELGGAGGLAEREGFWHDGRAEVDATVQTPLARLV